MSGVLRRPGDRWMLRGPIEYVPPVSVEVMLRRQAIPLDENEGIYVRDIKTGKVRDGRLGVVSSISSAHLLVLYFRPLTSSAASQVRAVIGHTYMLTHDEELWQKELPPNVEVLLASPHDPLADRSERNRPVSTTPRDKTKVVSFRVPHNAAVQVYDYREKRAR